MYLDRGAHGKGSGCEGGVIWHWLRHVSMNQSTGIRLNQSSTKLHLGAEDVFNVAVLEVASQQGRINVWWKLPMHGRFRLGPRATMLCCQAEVKLVRMVTCGSVAGGTVRQRRHVL